MAAPNGAVRPATVFARLPGRKFAARAAFQQQARTNRNSPATKHLPGNAAGLQLPAYGQAAAPGVNNTVRKQVECVV